VQSQGKCFTLEHTGGMITLFQRLLLGSLLLLALIAGLSFLVRGSFVSLQALDDQQKAMDHAVGRLTAARGALEREQILVERSLLHLPVSAPTSTPLAAAAESPAAHAAPAPRESDIRQESELAKQRLLVARDALADVPGAPMILPEIAAHNRVFDRLHHSPPRIESRMLSARELEPIDESLSTKLHRLEAARHRLDADLADERGGLRARLIGACGAALLAGIALVALIAIFTLRPLRKAARTARRIGQGDLTLRIDWAGNDELGVLTTEFNRLALRLRDLRDTETGRREMEYQMSDAVVQSLFEPVIVTDGRGQIMQLNKAARTLLGERAGDRTALNTTPGGEQILASIRTAISLQRAVGVEGDATVAPIRIGAAQQNYRLRTTPMRDQEGHLLGAVTVLEDVTELQAVDRFKTRFLAVASQKMRDPLEKLRIALHALARGYAGELRPLQADVVEGAREEAERMDDLMTDLFAVAELDSGNRALRLEPLRPLAVLREARANAHVTAMERGVTIAVEAYADLQRVHADRRALRSIFENLLSNAIRNTPSGGSIRLIATEGKDAVHFSVADTGRGIPPERLTTIFGRMNSSSPSGSGGTGLGLALVRRLVESQGGQISVESKVDVGTTFTITLPASVVTDIRHPVEAG
jgi:NtrC-family two-component system sensor histidine kinase KinB